MGRFQQSIKQIILGGGATYLQAPCCDGVLCTGSVYVAPHERRAQAVALQFGLGEKFKELFDEVQRSNMSKACDTEGEALATVNFYHDKKGTDAYYAERDGKYLVYRKGDKKTLKSINYSPADLESIIED